MKPFDPTAGFPELRTFHTASKFVDRLIVILLASLVVIGGGVYSGLVSPTGKVCNDFTAIYVAGQLALEGHATQAYDFQTMSKALATFCGTDISRMPWTYPPPFNLFAAALSLFPYGLSYLIFIGTTLIGFMIVLRRLSPSPEVYNLARVACLPSMCITIMAGQNGFLTGSLIGVFALLTLGARSSAGAPLGLLIIKPQLAMGPALLVLLQKRVSLLFLALIVALGAALLATAFMGMDIWLAFFHALKEAAGFLKNGEYPLSRMTSVYAAIFTVSGSATLAIAVQMASAIVSALILFLCVRKALPPRALLGAAILLSNGISPYVYDYDWVAFGVGAALIAPFLIDSTAADRLAFLALSWVIQGYGAYIALLAPTRIRDLVSLHGQPASIGGAVYLLLAAGVIIFLTRNPRLNKRRA